MSLQTRIVRYLCFLILWSASMADASDLKIDGKVLELRGNRVVVDVGATVGAEPGRTLYFYRHYAQVRDEVAGGVLSGYTFLGSAEIEETEAGSSVAVTPFLPLVVGDLVRLAPVEVLSVAESSRWIPQGVERLALQDPFYQRRRLNNRIQLLTEAARMGADDYYLGTTVDFTYWPNLLTENPRWIEGMRFGLGAFQGEAPALDGSDALEQVRFLFGLAEFDLMLLRYLNVLPSFKIGLNNRGFGAGGGLKLRVGTIQNTHLLAGFEVSGAIGYLAFVEYHQFPRRDLQFWIRFGIENLPSGQRNGGRAQLGAEYQVSRLVWARAAVGVGGRRSTAALERGINGELGLSFNFWTGKQ